MEKYVVTGHRCHHALVARPMLNASHCIMSDPPSSTSSGQPVDIEVLRSAKYGTYIHKYKQRDLILYALGLGCTKKVMGG